MKPARAFAAASFVLFVGVATEARADDPVASPSPDANANANANANASTPVATSPQGQVGASVGIGREPLSLPPPPKSSLLPIVLVGSGLAVATVGVILVVAAPKVPSTCNSDLHTCVRQPGESNEDFAKDQDRAGRAHTMPIAGWLTIGVGGMLAAAGGLTYLFGSDSRNVGAATPPPTRTAGTMPKLTPYAGPSGGGLVAVGTF